MTTDPEKAAKDAAHDETKKVGRGAVYLTFTKFWFMISGYIIEFALPRVFGMLSVPGMDRADVGKRLFGIYKNVNALSSVFNAFVVQGTTQAVSRFSGVNPKEADGVRRAGYLLQAMMGGGIFVILVTLAPWIASKYGNADEYTWPLRFAAIITLCYAFYAIFMGYMNGTRRFGQQALVDFSFSTLKVIGVVAGGLIGVKVWKSANGAVSGAMLGFAGSAAIVMFLGWWFCGRASGPGKTSVKSLFAFQIFTMMSAGASTWLLRGDQQIFQWLMKDRLGDAIDFYAAEYSAAMAFATIPYQAVVSITFVLFPLVSGTDASDREKMGVYIRQTTRYAAMIATVLVSLFIACPERTIVILYPANFAPAAAPLRILAGGYLAFSVLYIVLAIFTASGRAKMNLVLTIIACAVQAGLCIVLSPKYELNGAAISTLTAMMVALLIGEMNLRRSFGRGLPVGPILRILVCGVVTALVANVLLSSDSILGSVGFLDRLAPKGGMSKLMTVGGFAVCGILYIVLLLLTGALEDDDKKKFRKILKRS